MAVAVRAVPPASQPSEAAHTGGRGGDPGGVQQSIPALRLGWSIRRAAGGVWIYPQLWRDVPCGDPAGPGLGEEAEAAFQKGTAVSRAGKTGREGQKEVVEEGEQTNEVGETEDVDNLKDKGILPPTNVEGNGEGTGDEGTGEGNNEELTGNLTGTYEVTEESVITPEDGVQSDEEQVEDENASSEENAESSQEQEGADQNAETDNMTPEEILGKYESILDKYFK